MPKQKKSGAAQPAADGRVCSRRGRTDPALKTRTGRRSKNMKTTASRPVLERLLCAELFRGLPVETTSAFEAIQTRTSYPEGFTLFAKDQNVPGVFVLYAGSVQLSEPERAGKGKSRIAFPGEILQVKETVAGDTCRVAAQTCEPSEIGFIDRAAFEGFLCGHSAAAFRLVQLLSNAVAVAMERARSFSVCSC